MPFKEGKWNEEYARFKKEKGQITTALGKGRALELFNNNMIKYQIVDK